MLMKVAFRNPGLNLTNVLKRLPADADLDALKALVAPIVDRVNEVKRVDGGRVDLAVRFLLFLSLPVMSWEHFIRGATSYSCNITLS